MSSNKNIYSSFTSRIVLAMHGYKPGKQPKIVDGSIIKLNTNENPYPPLPQIVKAAKNFSFENFRRYPDPNQTNLRESAVKTLSKAFTLTKSKRMNVENIFFSNGSDEILNALLRTFVNPKQSIAFPNITYNAYASYATMYGIRQQKIKIKDFCISLEQHKKTIEKSRLFFLANPNAPTGQALSPDEIKRALKNHPSTLFVIDEAYGDFKKDFSLIPFVNDFENLIVVRTFSKSASLAGARIGYALAKPNLIRALRKTLDPYNLNSFSQHIAKASFSCYDDILKVCLKIEREREKVKRELEKRKFKVLPSSANFLYAAPPAKKGKNHKENALFWLSLLEKNKVYVRHFDYGILPESGYLRITIGTPLENKALFKCIDEKS